MYKLYKLKELNNNIIIVYCYFIIHLFNLIILNII